MSSINSQDRGQSSNSPLRVEESALVTPATASDFPQEGKLSISFASGVSSSLKPTFKELTANPELASCLKRKFGESIQQISVKSKKKGEPEFQVTGSTLTISVAPDLAILKRALEKIGGHSSTSSRSITPKHEVDVPELMGHVRSWLVRGLGNPAPAGIPSTQLDKGEAQERSSDRHHFLSCLTSPSNPIDPRPTHPLARLSTLVSDNATQEKLRKLHERAKSAVRALARTDLQLERDINLESLEHDAAAVVELGVLSLVRCLFDEQAASLKAITTFFDQFISGIQKSNQRLVTNHAKTIDVEGLEGLQTKISRLHRTWETLGVFNLLTEIVKLGNIAPDQIAVIKNCLSLTQNYTESCVAIRGMIPEGLSDFSAAIRRVLPECLALKDWQPGKDLRPSRKAVAKLGGTLAALSLSPNEVHQKWFMSAIESILPSDESAPQSTKLIVPCLVDMHVWGTASDQDRLAPSFFIDDRLEKLVLARVVFFLFLHEFNELQDVQDTADINEISRRGNVLSELLKFHEQVQIDPMWHLGLDLLHCMAIHRELISRDRTPRPEGSVGNRPEREAEMQEIVRLTSKITRLLPILESNLVDGFDAGMAEFAKFTFSEAEMLDSGGYIGEALCLTEAVKLAISKSRPNRELYNRAKLMIEKNLNVLMDLCEKAVLDCRRSKQDAKRELSSLEAVKMALEKWGGGEIEEVRQHLYERHRYAVRSVERALKDFDRGS